MFSNILKKCIYVFLTGNYCIDNKYDGDEHTIEDPYYLRAYMYMHFMYMNFIIVRCNIKNSSL